MIRTIVSNSGLSLASDNIFYVLDAVKNGLLAITKDDTADTLTLTFREKDNTQDGVETIVLECEDNKASEAAEDVISMMNGIATNAQIEKVVDLLDKANKVKGVKFAFTYDADNEGNTAEVDDESQDITGEAFTAYFEGLDASSGPYDVEAFVQSTDSSGAEDVVINGAKVILTGEDAVTATAGGIINIDIPGYYDNAGTDTVIPASDGVATVENKFIVKLTNIKSEHSVTLTSVAVDTTVA